MSITRSYNKHTDTYYAYDTTYEWDEKKQKKVQRKKCIGKFDPVTGELIPNGRRGRPTKQKCGISVQESSPTIEEGSKTDSPKVDSSKLAEAITSAEAIYSRIESIETSMSKTLEELAMLRSSLRTLIQQLLSKD